MLAYRPDTLIRRMILRAGCGAIVLAVLVPATLQAQEADSAPVEPAAPQAPAAPVRSAPPTLWDLTVQGGIFMIPIFACSLVVVTFAIERAIGLRRKRIIPPALVQAIERQTSDRAGFDPRAAYRLCQQYPSPMANVLRAALLKTGRPQGELEKAVEDAGAREADALARNVRPLQLCTTVAPLLGLIGTVQGMIMAFIVTSTTTATGTAKAQELAHGIYTALVTTFAGLCVAIPGVVFAHAYEGCIDRLVRAMEDIMVDVLARLERFEGRGRVRPAPRTGAAGGAPEGTSASEPAATPAPGADQGPPEPGFALTPAGRE